LTAAQLRACLGKIKALHLDLTENEMIQIANLLPESDVEYYLIIENNRLSEEQMTELKAIIVDHLPSEAEQ
jgi:hypothetical protein